MKTLNLKRHSLSRLSFYIFIPLLSMLLMSLGGGGGKNDKNPTPGGGTSCDTRTATLVLHPGNIDPGIIQGRSSTYLNFMPASNILNGGQAKSTTSLYFDTHLNYCHITITATNCSSYGNGGTKTYTWDSSNDGDIYDNRMNIELPNNGSFTVTVDLHEGCGPWNIGYKYTRPMWIHQGNYNPTDIISISSWGLNRVDGC